ncbi:MAG: hypothetical protein KAQ98_03085 [Bacteriovoracaceae bacterium]|nr:hypothetical protein [Bacteriovoracaceae bacterium]
MLTKKTIIKILTIVICSQFLCGTFVLAQIANQEKHKTYVRWNIFLSEDQLEVSKKADSVFIKTLNVEIFEKLIKDVSRFDSDKKYFSAIDFKKPGSASTNNVSMIEIKLADSEVELFHFYRGKENKYVLDFWSNVDHVESKKSAVAKKKIIKKTPSIKKQVVTVRIPDVKKLVEKETVALPKSGGKLFKHLNKYFDFRYGASFIWDYEPLLLKLKQVINIESKTAEYFYTIKDREYEKNAMEAHLQLTINLFRKGKWGLMHKSIKLFEGKYPDESAKQEDLHEYLKANALLRSNFIKRDPAPQKMAMNMYEAVAKRTKIYPLQKAIYKYMISFFISENEYVQCLKAAKRFYVLSLENFDREESVYAAETILYNLANLNQIETIIEFIREKTVKKILPAQIMIAYNMFTLLRLGRHEDVIRLYEKRKSALVKPIDPTILYNVAEAYFRDAKYQKSIDIFDTFLSMFSHLTYSSHARLRIALAHEVLEKDINKTLELYKNTINRSQSLDITYEAKIRYVALASIRRRNITKKDRELRIFLEKKSNSDYRFTKNINKLLWLVRLRSFIVDGKFKEALSYLSVIPLTSLSAPDARVFEGDGAEIVYGILFKLYSESEYSKVVKIWEIYREKYIAKVAMDPFLNFIVGNSYIKLGLYKGFEKLYSSFEKIKNSPPKTYPAWNKRKNIRNSRVLLLELKVMANFKLENWKQVEKYISLLEKIKPDYNRINYYKGMMFSKRKNYKNSAKYLELFLAGQQEKTVYDVSEVANLLKAYTDSLFEMNLHDKFKRVVKAVLDDTENYAPGNQYMYQVRERMAYLYIEMMASTSHNGKKMEVLQQKIGEFKRIYKKSSYMDRLNYLYAVTLVSSDRVNEGKKILETLVSGTEVANYIKELARSELSLLKIKDRTL